ncbi:hypothetical protein F5144DRAFT_258008 [Chaetomium tenue]|uniref:Uncharacterized protein n=1 Tax=Chaetomium tenue TaxID=1854479 RepID=A0ACB7PB28_9PEZI|nr:hypothetical protein F5144DRAFT_258008 [Chaetomium globosum]
MTCRWDNIFNIGVGLHKPRSHPDCEARLQNPAAVTVNACFWPPVTAGPRWHVPLQVHRYLVVLDGAWNAGFHVTAACRGPVPRSEPSIRGLPQTGRKENGISKANNFCFPLRCSPVSIPFSVPSPSPPPYLLFIRLAPTAAIPSRASAPIRPLCHGNRSPVCSLLLIKPQVSFHFHHHLRSPVSFGDATRYARGPVLPKLRGRFLRCCCIIGFACHIPNDLNYLVATHLRVTASQFPRTTRPKKKKRGRAGRNGKVDLTALLRAPQLPCQQ